MSSSDDDGVTSAPVRLRKRRRVCPKNLINNQPTKLFSVKLKPALNQAEEDISKILQGFEQLF